MTVGIYIRVSTQEQAQEGYSIAAQKERLTAYCVAQGWEDFKFYVDEGVSAKDTNRPELQRLFEHMKEGKIHTILVYRLDRFTRRVKDLYTMLEEMQKYNCVFKSATEPYDTSSAMGRMFIGLVALLAQWETENLSERVKMALEEKVSDGERVGNIPFGFDLDENEKLVANEDSILLKDIIKKTFNGWSSNRIANFLNSVNDSRNWHATAVIRLLRNPALYGATRWNDKVFENTHDGIITKEEFEKLQRILDDRTPQNLREVKSTYLFQGKLACFECKNTLAVNRFFKKRKDGSTYQSAIYRCNYCAKERKGKRTFGEYRFEDALLEYMKTVEIPVAEVVEEKDESHYYEEQLKLIEKKREKYQKAWAADLISDDEFTTRMKETKEVYEELKAKLDEIKTPTAVIDTEIYRKIVFTFNQSFTYLTQEEKQQFIQQFIKRIDFRYIPTKPKDPRAKEGKGHIVITNVEFY